MAEEKLKIIIGGDSRGAINAFGQVNKGIQTMQQKIQSAGQAMTSFGTKMSLAVTAPLVLIGKKSLEMAMDVVESENLFTVSMGAMGEAARKWSEEFASSVGLNEYNVRKQVGTFNVMLDSMGLTETAAYDMAKGMTTLAYDMASFYNLNVEEAFDKLKSGIVGMPRPLQDLGIVVNETTVQMYAYKNGIAAVGEELTESQKIMARYGAIMEQTSKAQGDLARTLESPANQMRIFKEQVNLAMIELGQGLIPVMQKVLNIVKPYIEKFTKLNDIQKEWIVRIAIAAAAAGPIFLFTGQLINAGIAVKTLTGYIYAMAAAEKTSIIFKGGGLLAAFTLAILQTGDSIQKSGYQSKEATKEYDLLNKSIKELNSASTGFVSAGGNQIESNLRKIREELINQPKAMEQARGEIDRLTEAYNDNRLSEEELIAKLQAMAKEYENINPMIGYYEQMHKNTYATDEAAESIDGLGESADGATEEIDNLTASLFELFNINQDVEEVAKKYVEAIKELEKVSKVYTKTNQVTEQDILRNINAQENLTKANENYQKVLQETPEDQKKILEAHIALTEAQNEAGEATKNITETTKNYKASQEEIIEKTNEAQGALENYMESIEKAIESDKTSTEEKRKLMNQYYLLGQSAIENGWIMRDEFNTVAADLKKNIDNTIIPGFARAASAANDYTAALNKIPKDLTITIRQITEMGYTNIGNIAAHTGQKITKQSGGTSRYDSYIPDLEMFTKKGEGIIPAYVMRAIKENRGSFAGLDTQGGSSVTNYFNIASLVVREEADVEKIAQDLYSMQLSSLRGAGIR